MPAQSMKEKPRLTADLERSVWQAIRVVVLKTPVLKGKRDPVSQRPRTADSAKISGKIGSKRPKGGVC